MEVEATPELLGSGMNSNAFFFCPVLSVHESGGKSAHSNTHARRKQAGSKAGSKGCLPSRELARVESSDGLCNRGSITVVLVGVRCERSRRRQPWPLGPLERETERGARHMGYAWRNLAQKAPNLLTMPFDVEARCARRVLLDDFGDLVEASARRFALQRAWRRWPCLRGADPE
jgi:hypothetical protein